MSFQIRMLPKLYLRSLAALSYAKKRNIPGLEFNLYGRSIGRKLITRGRRGGLEYLLTPVSSTRYFEFPFALSCLPSTPSKCLDISSPRLFSFYVAQNRPEFQICMANPDPIDIQQTRRITEHMNWSNLSLVNEKIERVTMCENEYDVIWSISVIEHISGSYDDGDAIEMMYFALKPKGRLILTVPVDRYFWNEYREKDYYNLDPQLAKKEKYFFQRFYDSKSIESRLVSRIGKKPSRISWFGEHTPGKFNDYIQRWLQYGRRCTVDDPREIADNYQSYASWEEMPGVGVCGLMFEKD